MNLKTSLTFIKRQRILKALLLVGTLNAISSFVFANTPVIVNPLQTQAQITARESKTTLKNRAKTWGLAPKDFQEYQSLMKNTPSGHWYKTLDPAEVLALSAKSPEEMMKYAKIQARMMHERVTRELLFDQMYTKAYQSLYPNEKPIRSKEATLKTSLKNGDHIWLFVGLHTILGRFVCQNILQTLQKKPNLVLDIYFVGSHVSDEAIQAWAEFAGIPPTLINRQVTLNKGAKRFKAVSQGKPVTLPYVGLLHNNHFQPISLSSVL